MDRTVHFTIGENFHEILLEVSRDHLINKDTKKAIEVFTLGLGMTNEMAIDIIKGELKLETNVESQELYVGENEKGDQWFEKKFKDILMYKIRNDIERFSYLHIDLLDILKKFVKKCVGRNNDYNFNIEVNVDFKTYISNGKVKVETPIPEIIEKCKKLISDLNNYHNLVVFGFDCVKLDDLFISAKNEIDKFSFNHLKNWNVKNLYDCEFNLCLTINHITNYNYNRAKEYLNNCDCSSLPGLTSVNTYINSMVSLDERDLSIPVHFYDSNISSHRFDDNYKMAYDAYWIDRDGNAYGADGSVANMLHINMADAICKKEGVEGNDDSSLILERKGWVKISKDWVLYTSDYMDMGDGNEIIKKPNPPMTDKQVDTVIRIISQGLSKNVFYVGYKKVLININQFKYMEPLMRNKLFNL
jgi:hypothetical protein